MKPPHPTIPVPEFSTSQEFDALTPAQKEAVWDSLDREFSPDELKPLSAAEREQWGRIKRKMGRPKVARGAVRVSASVERGLLRRADAYAKRHGLTRAQLIARGLTLAITHAR